MSRIPKWKVEKAKVKVVFRLQFHATHIPHPGWDKLFVSFIPSETGKVNAKTTKANVRNGNCKWSDPIYETTRLILDSRTKKYEEKLYKLVVAMGSSRSSLLGEVNINLADFADALKPSSVDLPLHGCDFGTVLHVTVQLLTSKTGFREFEQQREHTVKGFQMISGDRSHDPAEIVVASSDTASDQIDKVNARVRFKEKSTELPSLEEVGISNEDYEDSAAGIDGSSCTSGSLYAEKNDISIMHEIDSFKSTSSTDIGGFPLSQSQKTGKVDQDDKRLSAQGSIDWTHGWSSDYSFDNDLTAAYEENNRLRVRLEVAESAFVQLKLEAKSLQIITGEFSAETQSLAEQLATELASGKELTREVSILKSECSRLKSDVEKLKSAKKMQHIPERAHFPVIIPCDLEDASFNGKLEDNALASGQYYSFRDIQLDFLQSLLLIEGKVQEIQNKAFLEYHGSNFDLLRSDFEGLERVLENLKQGITQATSLELVDGTRLKEILQPERQGLERSCTDHHHPQGMLQFLTSSHQILLEKEALKENFGAATMEEMCELKKKLEESKNEKESLTKKIDQMECYYEALIQELEESQKVTLNELENTRSEHASCLYSVSALQSQMERMHQEMNEQLISFAEERHTLDSLNSELEKRAIASETALKRVRRNYAIAVDRLQKDLELLSFQVLSMYETNENLAKQAFTDASQYFFQHYPGEDSEVAKSCMPKDDVLISLHKEQLKPTASAMQSEIRSKISHESSPMLNGLSDKLNYKNFDLVEVNKGISQIGVPMDVELQMKDEGNAHVNGLKLEDIRQVASETQRSIELPRISIPKSKHGSQGTGSIGTLQISNQCAEPDSPSLDGKSGFEEIKLSLHMLKELKLNSESELSEMHMFNMQLEVFSEVLQETLCGVYSGVGQMKDHMDKLTQQLAHSADIEESLTHRLQTSLDDVTILRENEAKFISICDDLRLKNDIQEAKFKDILEENIYFIQKVAENERLMMEYQESEKKYNVCREEREEFENLLRKENLEKSCLQSEISCVIEDFRALREQFDKQSVVNDALEKTVSLLQEKLGDLISSMVSCNEQINGSTLYDISLQEELECKNYMAMVLHLEQFQQEACKSIVQLRREKREIEEHRDIAQYSLNKTESQMLYMKQKFESELKEIAKKLDFSNTVTEKLYLELQDVVEKLKISSVAEEKQAMRNTELLSKITVLELELQHATDDNSDLVHKLLLLEGVNEDLERTKLSFMNCMKENRNLMLSIESENEATTQIKNELNSFKESLQCTHDKLQLERKLREELEAAVTDLTSQLKEKGQQLLSLDDQQAELVHLRKRILDVEAENFGLQHLSLQTKESQRKLDGETLSLRFQIAEMENYLAAINEYSLTTDVERTYMVSQFRCRMQVLSDQLKVLEKDLGDLHVKHLDVVESLKMHTLDEEQLVSENAILSKALESLKLELETITSEKNGLEDHISKNSAMWTDFEDMKSRVVNMEEGTSREKQRYADEILQLKSMLVSFENEVDILRTSRDEQEVKEVILRSKLDEQQNQISFLEACDRELKKLREQHNELSYKLSDQILKTEEFRNLSNHLRELKDKADAECYQAREKKEHEGPSIAMQESLRVAFIKEQYESKIQELRNQLFVSKNYAEEMFLKLQNALDEVESGKKSEVSLSRRNEELSAKISDLEIQLQTVMTDRRDLVKTYDRMKAELECTILSLDCCKEEKLKLEASLQECNEERTKTKVELDLVKRLLENMASITGMQAQKDLEPGFPNTSIGELLEEGNSGFAVVCEETPSAGGACSRKDIFTAASVDPVNTVGRDNLLDVNMLSACEEIADGKLVCMNESSHSSPQPNLQALQDSLVPRMILEPDAFSEDNKKKIADIKEHFQQHQRLKTGMALLQKELERLKNENLGSLLPLEDNHFDSALQGLQRELTQLDTANEHLGSIFPLFKDLHGGGNALERVLALELELAESLQAKKISDVRFQSSFLKQHNDDEAVYQSFRDINDLIKDMLELKRRNAAVETELKEMQARYSQLSLQFAEVEGERQKLVMTLKNRLPKKP